jgi:hypothetical protein
MSWLLRWHPQGRNVSPKRTDLDPGAVHVGGNNLIGEGDTHRVEGYVPPHRVDIASLNSV